MPDQKSTSADTAAVLRHIADLIEDGGLPVPLGIRNSRYTGTEIQVDVEHLTDWLTALEVPEPIWIRDSGNFVHAHFEPGTFNDAPFALSCCFGESPAVAS